MREKNLIYRHELKFILSPVEAEIIRQKIACICFPDEHAVDGKYNICSLYFDTPDDRFLMETLDGVNVRHKYRIRRYGTGNNVLKLEKKSTEAGLKHKDTDFLEGDQLDKILDGDLMVPSSENQKILREFQTEALRYCFKPACIVEYTRKPYVYPIGNVRITFDYDIYVSDDFKSFKSDIIGLRKPVAPGKTVLEVKYDDILPNVIRKILNSSGNLNQTAFSKYAMSRMTLSGK